MRTKIVYRNSKINTSNALYIGESIERKCERVTTTGEVIEAVSPMVYTDKKDGVRAEFDIRTDKWDVAEKAMDYVTKEKAKKRQEWLKAREENKDSSLDKPNSDKPSQHVE